MCEIGKIKDRKIKCSVIEIKDEFFKNLHIDCLIKSSILSTIAGYLKENDIYVNEAGGGRCDVNFRSLEKFLSYLINDKNFSPMSYDISLTQYQGGNSEARGDVKEHEYDTVVLFSGGFDSSAALLYALDRGWNPLLLWVGFGQKNEREERIAVRSVAKKIEGNLLEIRLDLKKFVDLGWKDWSYIVPARNFIFSVFGASVLSYSKSDKTKIIMGVHDEEINHPNPGPDKSPYFFRHCTELFTEFYKKDIVLSTPFESISKTELAAHWANTWQDKYNINPHETISCYYGSNCGECNACFKRSVSFLSSGIGLDDNIKTNPFMVNPDFVDDYIKRCFGDSKDKKRFDEKRRIDTLLAFSKVVTDLPNYSKDIMLNLSPKLNKELKNRERELSKFIWKYDEEKKAE